MNFLKFFTVFISGLTLVSCGMNKYQSNDFQNKTQNHRIVAVLPAVVTNTATLFFNSKEIKDPTNSAGQEAQRLLYNELLSQKMKKKNPIIIDFQDIVTTNQILQSHSIGNRNLSAYSMTDLAKILDVDAVVYTTIEQRHDVAGAVISGKASSLLGKIILTSALYNGSDGSLLWRNFDSSDLSPTDLPADVLTRYAFLTAYNFPYR
jgi:hypothetical protein